MQKEILFCLLLLISCIAKEPPPLTYSYDQATPRNIPNNLGIINNYKIPPKDHLIQIDCKFYDFDMMLVHSFGNGYLCKRVTFKSKLPFIADDELWGVMDEGTFSVLNEDGTLLWMRNSTFTHDFTFSRREREFYILQRNIESEKDDRSNEYFSILKYSEHGKLLSTWSIKRHFQELYKNHEAEFKSKESIDNLRVNLHPNYLHYFESDWMASDGTKIPAGSLAVYISQVSTLMIFDQQFNIIWRYDFKKFIHTPRFLKNGNILVFKNRYLRSNSTFDSIDTFDTKVAGKHSTVFKIPHAKISDRVDYSINGSVQILSDGSLFISTGSDGSGVIHLSKENLLLFHWSSPTIKNSGPNQTFYRARLIPISWLKDFLPNRDIN